MRKVIQAMIDGGWLNGLLGDSSALIRITSRLGSGAIGYNEDGKFAQVEYIPCMEWLIMNPSAMKALCGEEERPSCTELCYWMCKGNGNCEHCSNNIPAYKYHMGQIAYILADGGDVVGYLNKLVEERG